MILKNKKKINQILKLFTKLKKIGVVKNFGVSVKSPQDALIIIKKYKQFNFIQLNFSLVDQRALEYGVLDAAYKNKVSIIARTPLAFGYLTGKVRVKKNDHRKKWGIKQANIWTKGRLKFSRAINRKKLSPTSLALLFATYHPAIKTVIPGMMKIKQVKMLNCRTKRKTWKKRNRKIIRLREQQVDSLNLFYFNSCSNLLRETSRLSFCFQLV